MKRIVLIGFLAMVGGCTQDVAPLNAAAGSFARSLGYKVTGVNCMDMDSDGDGYVSCTVGIEGKGPLAVECASAYSIKSGCRMQKFGSRMFSE